MDHKKGKRTLKVLAWASFLNDLGAEMIYPIWPFFVTNILKANMSALGLIDGLGDAMVSLSQAGSGYLSDKLRKRKIFIWLGYFCGSMSRIGYAITTTWPMLIPYRILDRAGKIRAAPRDAIVADISQHSNRGEHFGFLRMADYLGGVGGIIACIFLLNILPYQKIFIIAAVPSLIGVVLLMVFLKETSPVSHKVYRAVSFSEITPNLKLLFVVSGIFALATFSYSFLLIYATHVGFGVKMIPLLYLGYNVVASIFSMPAGRLSDRIGRKGVMFLSFLLWGLACGVLMWEMTQWTIIVTLVLYGMHKAVFDTVPKAFVSELAPVQFRASCLGYYQMIIGLCALPASFMAGILWDKVGVTAPLKISLILTFVASILLFFVTNPKTTTEAEFPPQEIA